jgi:hypothetical protein
MSYSYIKTTFPNFKYTNVYDTKIYNDVVLIPQSNLNTTNKFTPFSTDTNEFKIIDPKLNQFQSNDYISINNNSLETFQDNLKYYNKPLNENKSNINPFISNSIEKYESDNIRQTQEQIDHTIYVKHVLECSICKDMVLKQLNIESDRLFKEEILEILSYIVFAFFILMLLDSK